jgi:hypothetical protein
MDNNTNQNPQPNDDPMTKIDAAIPALDFRINSGKQWRLVIFRTDAEGRRMCFLPADNFATWAEANAHGIAVGMAINKRIDAARESESE